MAEKRTGGSKAAARSSTAGKARKATANPSAARHGRAARAGEQAGELSEDVLAELERGAHSALDAVRDFMATVDRALPPGGEKPSGREEVTDSALVMAQRLVHTQAEFLRKVVGSASSSLSRAGRE